MGFFERIFGKKPPAEDAQKSFARSAEEKLEIKAEGLEAWLAENCRDKIESAEKGLSEKWAELITKIRELQSDIKILEKAKFEPDDKTYATINMTKDAFVTKSRLLNKIPDSIGKNFSGIKSAYDETAKILSDMKDADARQAYIISAYFKKEADGVIKKLKGIEQLLSEIGGKLEADWKILELVEKASVGASRHRQIAEELSLAENSITETSGKISRQTIEIKSLKGELAKFLEGNEWLGLQSAARKTEEICGETERLKYEFNERMSPLKRPLKKMLHDAEAIGLTKEQKEALSSEIGIENPENFYAAISVMNDISSGKKTGLNPEELEKISKFSGTSSAELENLRKKYLSLMNEKTYVESRLAELSFVENLKKDKELKINSIESEMSRLIFERDGLIKQKEKLKQELESQKNELQKGVSEGLGREALLV